MASTSRFLRAYLRPGSIPVQAVEVTYQRGAEHIPATIFRPAARRGALPGWVVLHGLTRTGRSHPALQTFVRAVAAAGNVVLVPEIPEWRDLRVAPAVTVETIRAAVRALQDRDDIRHEHAGLFGFSFGATQALSASSDPGIARLLSGIAAWGGYSDIRRLFHFGLTGLHELDGVTYRSQPDPYGTWIMAGNYLTAVRGYEDARPVAQALHALALESGERQIPAWDPVYDAVKQRLRAHLPPACRELFDLIAPETGVVRHDETRARNLADGLADAALRTDPLLEPHAILASLTVPILFAHGRDDRLIPFTESVRLARAVPPALVRGLTITALFEHSGGASPGLGPLGIARESVRFAHLLRSVLHLV